MTRKFEARGLHLYTFNWLKPLLETSLVNFNYSADDNLFALPDDIKYNEDASTISKTSQNVVTKTFSARSRLMTIILRLHCARVACLVFLHMITDFCSLLIPSLLYYFIEYLCKDGDLVVGCSLGCAMLCFTFIGICCDQVALFEGIKLRIRIRGSISAALYQKVLSVNRSTLSTFTLGQISTFITVDSTNISFFFLMIQQTISTPLLIVGVLSLLYHHMGYCFLSGLLVCALSLVISKFLIGRIMSLSNECLRHKDSRIKMLTEVLNNIQAVKFCSMENCFLRRLNAVRSKELSCLRRMKLLYAIYSFMFVITPPLMGLVIIATYVATGNILTTAKVFTMLGYLNILTGRITFLPECISCAIQAVISTRRLQQFFDLPHFILEEYYDLHKKSTAAIEMKNCHFSWLSDDSRTACASESRQYLSNISLTIPKGSLVGIVGKVGSGKTSLLAAINGDMFRESGSMTVSNVMNGFGFVPEEAWLQSTSVRNNILMGAKFDEKKYLRIIKCCALENDFDALLSGDATPVGENGISLSGGQRTRVSLARAVYHDKEIYLLDDPLSSVDACVGKHIFTQCIQNELKNKTRIMTTHHIGLLQKTDVIIIMKEGQLWKHGKTKDVLPMYLQQIKVIDDRSSSTPRFSSHLLNKFSDHFNFQEEAVQFHENGNFLANTKRIEVYWIYIKHFGFVVLILFILTETISNVASHAAYIWLSYWTRLSWGSVESSKSEMLYLASLLFGRLPISGNEQIYYLIIYVGIIFVSSIFALLRFVIFTIGAVHAAQRFQFRLLQSVFRYRSSYMNSAPIGSIVNRFSNDVYKVDDSLPLTFSYFLSVLLVLVGNVIIIMLSLPYIFPFVCVLIFVFYNVQKSYRVTACELRRLVASRFSPLFNHFNESLRGISVIRSHRLTNHFTQVYCSRLRSALVADFNESCLYGWLNIRLQFIGVGVLVLIIIYSVVQKHLFADTVNSALLALTITYSLFLRSLMAPVISSFCEIEKDMISLQRILEYIHDVPQENLYRKSLMPARWPSSGLIEFRNVNMHYDNNKNLAISSFSLTIPGSSKLAIVGRTGSGKSTLLAVLFRLECIANGDVLIDNVSIYSLPLREYRSKLAIIPQHPFLFNDSVRANVDPFALYSDEEIWNALCRVHISEVIRELGGLSYCVGEEGRNISIGQRQLLCLARVLLKDCKILCMDEATANIDQHTDKLIQNTIREEFSHCTVITVAHRLSTVMDYDDVIVLEKGSIVEKGNPKILSQSHDSKFYSYLTCGL